MFTKQMVHGFEAGLVLERYQLFLFGVCGSENGQQCELHEVCGKTICVGEVACIERESQNNGELVLRGYSLREGIKSCIFGSIKVEHLKPRIASFFEGNLVQVVSINKSELEAAQNPSLNGVMKVIVIGEKDKTVKE